jgi:O-acetyl-ADP-ribose deacetylase (regulator of RNase III)
MGVEYIKQDVTRVGMGIVAHGVNCQHKMGSGVAKAIRRKWPQVYQSYMNHPKGKVMLGCCALVPIDEGRDDLFVANLYTQQFYGYGGGKYADTTSIETSLSQCAIYADMYDLPIFMPRIGCGLGGLKWDDVEPIVLKISERTRNPIYVCDLL